VPQSHHQRHRRINRRRTSFRIGVGAAEPGPPLVAVSGRRPPSASTWQSSTLRCDNLPLVVVIGNDAPWNAEHQIQLRSYGAQRTHSCERSIAPSAALDPLASM
jgi:acetolactate synthase-1/2/3 large subunit